MKFATWNVNSVKARLELIVQWMREEAPDVCAFQELKCVDEAFPREAFESLGYNIALHGQKTYNGVALLSKFPLMDVRTGLPGDDTDEQSRYIEAVIDAPVPVRVTSIYLPNGNPVGTDKYAYKLRWLERLYDHAASLLKLEEKTLLSGDFNIIPQAIDCYRESAWLDDALYQREVRDVFQAIRNLGYTDAFSALPPADNRYTFWDYQAGAWQKNEGIRIDHHLLSPQAADLLMGFTIHKSARGMVGETAKPSDHVPVCIDLTTS
jgi:exodeoxyribonuclease III